MVTKVLPALVILLIMATEEVPLGRALAVALTARLVPLSRDTSRSGLHAFLKLLRLRFLQLQRPPKLPVLTPLFLLRMSLLSLSGLNQVV